MKPSLKKEWDQTEIGPQILWQTRNRAWKRLQKRRRQRNLGLAAAALASLAALLFLWVSAPSGLPSTVPTDLASANPKSPTAEEMSAFERAPEEQAMAVPQPKRGSKGEVEPELTAASGLSPHPAVRPGSDSAENSAAKQPALTSAPAAHPDQELQRLVMNFHLPQSGVRMIWIKQKTLQPTSGGTG